MKAKNWIFALASVAILSWPGVELYRNHVAHQQLEASLAVERSISAKLASLKSAQVAEAKVPGSGE